ncbi:hypothetical protein LCGC14_0221710 [marine sediment metagenome]|uniref:Single-stranded DNA-binding protein n=1 Tax=marine sediment metagenome TaxID=412755 RepID=A0A0F9XHB2_9ZZZZ
MAELGVFGVGVATADSELRTVGEDQKVCTVNLAFNRSYRKRGEDKWQQEPCFVRVTVWGNRAERMVELVKKGQPVYVVGYLKQETWEKDGQKRVAYSINARDFQLCEKLGKKNSEPQAVGATTAPAESPVNDDSDIPF